MRDAASQAYADAADRHRGHGDSVTTAHLRERVLRSWLAARVALWLCILPVRLRRRSLTTLLDDEPGRARAPHATGVPELDRVVQTVLRVCRLPVFTAACFPRTCLREALALYHVLRKMGYPVRLHVGVYKEGRLFGAHSWVTVDGKLLVPFSGHDQVRPIFSHPARGEYAAEEE
jgi:hypothetical protein